MTNVPEGFEHDAGPLPVAYTIPAVWVTDEFRATIAQRYNLVDQADFALFQWMAFSGMRDDDDKAYAVTPKRLIRSIHGDAGVHETLREYGARTGLFRDIVPPNRWDHKATMVKPDLDQATNELIAAVAMSATGDMEGKVDFVTGEPWSPHNERKALSEQAKIMDAFSAPGHPAEAVVRYLHDKRVRNALRALLRKNHGLIIEAIDRLSGTTASGMSKREIARRVYLNVQHSHLAYGTVRRTDRIYAVGASLLQLSKEVRAAVFTGCTCLDVKNCQLAIVAWLWDIPELRELLKTVEDVWEYFAEQIGVDPAEYRCEIKRMVYCIIFGGGIKRLRRESQFADVFVGLPEIQQLIEHRNMAKAGIQEAGGMTDAFGRQWRLSDTGKSHPEEQARSLLARQVQSYEMAIMLAGFEVILNDPDMLMMAWLHDGIYVYATHNNKNVEYKINRVCEAIEKKAKEIGFAVKVKPQ